MLREDLTYELRLRLIEQRTEALCVALLRMPAERARGYARDLEHIVHGLDTLHDTLNATPA